MDITIADDFVQATLRNELKSLERQRSFLSSRVSNLNRLFEEKCAQVEKYQKALEQERLLKESTIGKLTRLKHYGHIPSYKSLNLDQNSEYEHRKLKVELELVEEELEKIKGYQVRIIVKYIFSKLNVFFSFHCFTVKLISFRKL